ncbi:MAG TPA: polysaccharide deacetylase family protein [Pirellulales bacterium]|nr:polysaccharide deacetylase family protein [Pirellulales bacterium]
MFRHHGIYGRDLPEKTLCLTYDDGPGENGAGRPGPNTSELGRYLYDEGIAATFFVMGKHGEQYPQTLARLHAWGHLIGNHTYSHPGLVKLTLDGGDVVDELARTHEIIRPHVDGDVVYFRPPYGNWRQKSRPDGPEDAPRSIVAAALNRDGRLPNYVGPILWDILAEDWECWRQCVSPEECAARHLQAIERVGRGIVLLHDSSEEDDVRPRNRTCEMTQLLVPQLKARGYRFVRLDHIPRVRKAAQRVHSSVGRQKNGGQKNHGSGKTVRC